MHLKEVFIIVNDDKLYTKHSVLKCTGIIYIFSIKEFVKKKKKYIFEN